MTNPKTPPRQDKTCKSWAFGRLCGNQKPQGSSEALGAYPFTPENQKKFCQYIKGVKLPDGFGSCFKHKVTDNDTNITGLKSHDCHIMMQRLLPYGLQNYLPDNIAKPIIELSSLFKQLCSATLMEDDMLKASVKVVEILCELERIYPPAFFDIMIHLPIHLALEALEGGPIHPRWMFPFERFMKKLKEPDDSRLTTQNSGIYATWTDGEGKRGVTVVENEHIYLLHLENSSDLPPSTSGNDLDNVTFYIDLHIDGESTEVDATARYHDVLAEDDG
ncbi:hypothetical protein Tco_0508366 [Tanacetum coccineum]